MMDLKHNLFDSDYWGLIKYNQWVITPPLTNSYSNKSLGNYILEKIMEIQVLFIPIKHPCMNFQK